MTGTCFEAQMHFDDKLIQCRQEAWKKSRIPPILKCLERFIVASVLIIFTVIYFYKKVTLS